MLHFKDKFTLTLLLLVALFSQKVAAQQDPMYANYLVNGLAINPAYAGSRDALTIVATHRHQWVGFEGAPTTQVLTAHKSMGEKIAAGLSLVNDKIGVQHQLQFFASGAYRLRWGNNNLQFGLQAGFINYKNNWDDVTTMQNADPVFSSGNQSFMQFNVGTGLYFYNQKFFAGISVPKLLDSPSEDMGGIPELYKHYFLTAGTLLNLNQTLKLKPSVLVKYVQAAPVQFDLNLAFILKDMIWLGGSFRTDDGLVFSAQFHAPKGYWIGYSYEYPLTAINKATNATHEISIGFDWEKVTKRLKIMSPRYF